LQPTEDLFSITALGSPLALDCMSLMSAASQEKVHSICALLEQEGVSGNVIEEFKRSLRDSDLPADDKRSKMLAAAALFNPRVDNAQGGIAASPSHGTNAWPSLSPIQLERFNLSPSSCVSSSSLRHSGRITKDRGECFDRQPAAVNYDCVAVIIKERTSLVQKLLRSPRPPTTEEKMRRSHADADAKFDRFSEHHPKMQGLKQLYIPPPSPKVSQHTRTSTLATQSGSTSASSPNSPSTGFAARPVHKSIPFLLDQRFDDFPDQDYHQGQQQRNL